MGTARMIVAAAAMGLAVPVEAQEFVIYQFSFVEVLAGTSTPVPSPNGVVEPGEGARILFSAGFVPGVGSPVTYQAPPAPGFGTVAGLGSVFFDLFGSGMAQGSWSHLRVSSGWNGMPIGIPLPDGSGVAQISVGQFVLPGGTPNPSNPVVDMWYGVWTPASYTPRVVTFQSQASPASQGSHSSILIEYGRGPENEPLIVGRFIEGQFGSVQVPIGIPAPGGLALLGLAPLGCRRKR